MLDQVDDLVLNLASTTNVPIRNAGFRVSYGTNHCGVKISG